MVKQNNKDPEGKPSQIVSLGIPQLLRKIRIEKATEPCPVKLQLSLKNFLKKHAGAQGVSGWIRETVIEKLIRMEEGSFEQAES